MWGNILFWMQLVNHIDSTFHQRATIDDIESLDCTSRLFFDARMTGKCGINYTGTTLQS